jgi:hypothetical protein
MKRSAPRLAAALVLAGGSALALIGGVASASGATNPSALPTLTLALNGRSVTVGGSEVSGAVNVRTTVTREQQGEPTLFHLSNGVSFAQFGRAIAIVNAHHGDLNYLDPYGSLVYNLPANKGTSAGQVVLAPGNYFALDTISSGPPPHAAFTVTQSPAPARLPPAAATLGTIEFGFIGPRTLHDGEMVRFVNDGFLVHMDAWGRVKNVANAKKAIALLKAGKDNKAGALFLGFSVQGAGPLSSGGIEQQVIHYRPGIYVQACFMDTQDGREHTRLGMERMIKIVK